MNKEFHFCGKNMESFVVVFAALFSVINPLGTLPIFVVPNNVLYMKVGDFEAQKSRLNTNFDTS